MAVISKKAHTINSQTIRGLNHSRAAKWLVAGVFTAVFALASPQYFDEAFDQLWVEEAHKAMLTGLVDARNIALEFGVEVTVCAADVRQQCVGKRAREFNGWLAFYVDKKGRSQTVGYYPFYTGFVGLMPSERYTDEQSLGFDRDGFSLQQEVVAFDIYSLSGRTHKSYTLVIEPSGALQTLVNKRKLPGLSPRVATAIPTINL